jgi:hypothetical protein
VLLCSLVCLDDYTFLNLPHFYYASFISFHRKLFVNHRVQIDYRLWDGLNQVGLLKDTKWARK